jgi:hypothetical protein
MRTALLLPAFLAFATSVPAMSQNVEERLFHYCSGFADDKLREIGFQPIDIEEKISTSSEKLGNPIVHTFKNPSKFTTAVVTTQVLGDLPIETVTSPLGDTLQPQAGECLLIATFEPAIGKIELVYRMGADFKPSDLQILTRLEGRADIRERFSVTPETCAAFKEELKGQAPDDLWQYERAGACSYLKQ